MKKIISAILLLFNLSYDIEQTLPMELLNTWESVDEVILKLKRNTLFVCLQEFNPQSDFVDRYIISHSHPDVWHIVPTNLLDELTFFY